jgi:hypothetical protein
MAKREKEEGTCFGAARKVLADAEDTISRRPDEQLCMRSIKNRGPSPRATMGLRSI